MTLSPLARPDPQAFVENQAFLRRLARSLVHDSHEAEDLVQDTWAAWAERGPARLGAPRAWFARVLRHRALNLRRTEERRRRREGLGARAEASEELDPQALQATLEVQARVVEVLRGLEEPYRSTLLLRYFHDRSPAEIARGLELSVHTIKSRLARGLERMRAELDRRSAEARPGRRAALEERGWRHWLCLAAGLPRPPATPREAGSPAGPRSPARSGSGLVQQSAGLLLAAGGCALAALGTLLAQGWRAGALGGRLARSAPLQASVSLFPGPAPAAPSRSARSPQPPVDAAPARRPAPEVLEWHQFAGGPAHDNLRPELADLIRHPRVLWHVPGVRGQPTASGGELYCGGEGLWRIDAASGQVLARVLEPEPEPVIVDPEPGEPEGPGTPPQTVTSSPALTPTSVLARRTDGGVSAFDRTLTSELWSWTPATRAFGHWPGCLAGDLFLVTLGNELVALSVRDGSERWRFVSQDGELAMSAACDQGRVFIGAEGGLFHALDLVDGHELWRTDTLSTLGWTQPVVVDGRVLFGNRGASGARPGLAPHKGQVLALATGDGRELWRSEFGATGFSTPGVGPGYVVAGFGTSVARFDLTTGVRDDARRLRTGRNAFGSPTVVGRSLVFGNLDGNLYVHDLESGQLRWRFQLPSEQQAHDFVHAGDRLYLATTLGLFCIADDPARSPVEPGFVLTWTAPGAGGD